MNKIPFDLKYAPDLIFSTDESCARVFPINVGQGTLILRPNPFFNFAQTAMIIDDYLIQFAGNGFMYLLEIPNSHCLIINCVDIYNDSRVVDAWKSWVNQTAYTAVNMNKKFNTNDEAYRYLSAFSCLLFNATIGGVSKEVYQNNYNGIKAAFGVTPNSNKMELKNNVWYFDGKRTTWGGIAHSIFRDYFSEFMTMYQI